MYNDVEFIRNVAGIPSGALPVDGTITGMANIINGQITAWNPSPNSGIATSIELNHVVSMIYASKNIKNVKGHMNIPKETLESPYMLTEEDKALLSMIDNDSDLINMYAGEQYGYGGYGYYGLI